MTKTRNLSDLLDSSGDVKSGALDNVPASDVVNDTTPQLGGDLDVNGQKIVSASNGDIELEPNGTGDTVVTSGNVGIGTTSPSSFTGYSTLSINNATNGGIMNLMVNGTETARLQAYSGIFNIAAKGASTNLTFETNGTERMKINADGSWGSAPAGTVLQVKNGLLTSSGSMAVNATANVSIPNCQVTITPTSSSSKFLIFARVMGETNAGSGADMGINIYRTTSGNNGFVNTADVSGSRARVLQNLGISYDIADSNSTPEHSTVMVLDSPATTNSITYNIQIMNTHPTVNRTWYINRVISTLTASNYERGSTEIVVQEIAG